MTDLPLQSFLRFIAIDIHKHYLMIGAIDAHKQVIPSLAASSFPAGHNRRTPICCPPMRL